jgi:hypothetical protein
MQVAACIFRWVVFYDHHTGELIVAEPVDAIRAIHNAFRKDMEPIDAAALDSARGEEDLSAPV